MTEPKASASPTSHLTDPAPEAANAMVFADTPAANDPHFVRPIRVYAAIRNVMKDMAKSGVGKNKTNAQQNFAYRGVDDVMDALAPSLSTHGLIIVPHVTDRITTERESRSGGTLFHTLLRVDYDFISVDDGSQQHVGPIYGEAMDSGDKATNKAMAVAYKYACVQTFCIPVTGDDPDAHTHEVAGAQAAKEPPRSRAPQRAMPARPEEPARSAATTSQGAEPLPRAQPPRKPEMVRPGGIFGYGKKHYEVPWNVMRAVDLEWFLNNERTPQNIREKIAAEMAWRDYETETLEAGIARQRAEDLANPISDDIP